MHQVRSRAATLTREQFKRGLFGYKPSWLDMIDPISPSIAMDDARTARDFVEEHVVRCPADTARLGRRWFERGIPRNATDHRKLLNRLSPLPFHTFDNRFGRFDE